MKFTYSLRLIALLAFLLCCLQSNAQLNCTSTISYEVNSNNASNATWSISVDVSTSGDYDMILSITKGTGPEEVQTVRYSRKHTLTFDKLEKDKIYELLAIFHTEEGLCRKRVVSGITIDNL